MVYLMTEILASEIIFELLNVRLTVQHHIQRTAYKNGNSCHTCHWNRNNISIVIVQVIKVHATFGCFLCC